MKMTDAMREALGARKDRRAASSHWRSLTEARRSAEKIIGRRGCRAVEQCKYGAGRAAIKDLARKYRRAKIRRLTDVVAAIDEYRDALVRWDKRREHIAHARKRAWHPSVHPSRRGSIHDRLAWRRAEILRADLRVIWAWIERDGRLEGGVTHGAEHAWSHSTYTDWAEWRARSRRRQKYPPHDQHVIKCTTPYLSTADLPGRDRIIGGLLTIAATRVEHESADVTAWRARWLRHGRGYDVYDCSGYIAQVGAAIAHGETLAGAVRTARRRLKAATRNEIPLDKCADIKIDWAAARAAGMCRTGIRSWVARHFPGLDPRRDSVTIAQALATSTAKREVMAVCRYVARHR